MLLTAALVGITAYALLCGRVPFPWALGIAVGLACLALCGRHKHRHGALLSMDAMAHVSQLAHCNSGLKVVTFVATLFISVAARSMWISLFVLLCMTALTVAAGKIAVRYYARLFMLPLVFIIMGTVALLFAWVDEPLGVWNIPVGRHYLAVTQAGQQNAVRVIVTAIGAVSCLYALSLSTPMHEVIRVLRRCHVPAIAIELMYLIYRYLFVLLQQQHQMTTAAKARLGNRSAWRTIRTALLVSSNLLYLSFRRATGCFDAMEARCYDGEIRFLESARPLTPMPVALSSAFLLVLGAMWLMSAWGHLL